MQKNNNVAGCIQRGLCILAICMLVLSLCLSCITASAATFEGKGTAKSPYLVRTAEQLSGIRDNLKAVYKLDADIDLSGISSFEPIGHLDAPFKGTFTCDLGQDGKPKYTIKGLQVFIAKSAYTKKNINKWEAGLFGATDGAKIQNIYVFDAIIKNDNVGLHQIGNTYSEVNYGMDEMGAGILIGIAKNTLVNGCGTSGRIDAKCNHCGGLIGSISGESSTVKNSFSTAEVQTTGYWCTGGLIGTCNANVSNCYASGNVTGGGFNTGGFAGSITLGYSIRNSYCTGLVNDTAGNSFIGLADNISSNIFNCYTTSSIAGKTSTPTSQSGVNSNCILSTSTGLQKNFKAVTAAELLDTFKSLDGWTTEGQELPQLSCFITKTVTNSDETQSTQIENEVTISEQNTASETTSSESEGGEIKNAEKEDTQTILNIPANKNPAEKILVIVLSSIIGVLMLVTGYALFVVIHTARAHIYEISDESIGADNDDE